MGYFDWRWTCCWKSKIKFVESIGIFLLNKHFTNYFLYQKSFSFEIQKKLHKLSEPEFPVNVKIVHIADYEVKTPGKHHFDIEAIRAASHKSKESYGEKDTNALIDPYTPDRFDIKRLMDDLKSFGAKTELEMIPSNNSRSTKPIAPVKYKGYKIIPPTVIIVEGLYALYHQELCQMGSMKVFVDLDGDTRLGRWILSDAKSNHAVFIAICNEYINYCRPEMENYLYKTKDNADIILPQGNEPECVELVANGIYDKVVGEYTEFVKGKHPEFLIDSIQSPYNMSLSRAEVPPLLDLASEIKADEYYDVN